MRWEHTTPKIVKFTFIHLENLLKYAHKAGGIQVYVILIDKLFINYSVTNCLFHILNSIFTHLYIYFY